MIIDAHVHVGNFGKNYPYVESNLDKIFQILKKEKIDYAIVSSGSALVSFDCSFGNQEALMACKKYKNLFPLLVCNPRNLEETMNSLKNIRKKGFVGVKLHPELHNYPLNSWISEPILKFCEEEKIPILTHSTGQSPLCGANAIKDVAEKFPNLKLIIGHGGIFSDRDVAKVSKDYSNLYIEISVEYECKKLEETIEIVGFNKIIFGSDYPFHHPSVMLQRIKVIELPKEIEEKILWKNAKEVFSLKI
ncbi:MAG: amidohydrolase family protein [Candidatus Ratteibacteria bacterium]